MKPSIFFYITLTTLLLALITVLCTLNTSYALIFYLTVVGQAMLVLMVYKVLRDQYTTTKTFENLYEDRPIEIEEENYR